MCARRQAGYAGVEFCRGEGVAGRRAGELHLPDPGLKTPATRAGWFSLLYNKAWVVYVKRPLGGPQQVLSNLVNYIHTPAWFDLPKGERIKRATVPGTDLKNHLILITLFFDRDHFCGNRGHLKTKLLLLAELEQTTFSLPGLRPLRIRHGTIDSGSHINCFKAF
jgi:hypothetical protein